MVTTSRCRQAKLCPERECSKLVFVSIITHGDTIHSGGRGGLQNVHGEGGGERVQCHRNNSLSCMCCQVRLGLPSSLP